MMQFPMESQADVPISAFLVAAISPGRAAVVPATAWAQMDCLVKVSTCFDLAVNIRCVLS